MNSMAHLLEGIELHSKAATKEDHLAGSVLVPTIAMLAK
jgi:hypothetical protein